ncbi:MAG: hypothetical protein GXO39_08925 [Thermotogae bacterium]|nr:hypothetical protein [Thermotogota bacterium]
MKKAIVKKAPKEVREVIENLDIEKDAELQKELLKALSEYNDQLIRELEVRERYKTAGKLSKMVRPVITFLVVGSFNTALLVGLLTGEVSFREYMSTLAPINSMLLGFWFGERSALKDPRKALLED